MPNGPASQHAWKLRDAHRRSDLSFLRPRPRMTTAQVDELVRLMKDAYKWENGPRPFQMEGIRAQIEGIDTMIQAPTGSGKTAIAAGPHLWPANQGKVTIMVSPLLALEEEMVGTFKTDFNLTAVAVNSQCNFAQMRQNIRGILRGEYRIILISPEMLQSQMFKTQVLRNQRFSSRVLSVILDEAHCLSHWGSDFRKHYNSLGTIRAFLRPGTPIIALTATLTARVRRDLHTKLHFPKLGSKFVNVGNDRPNVSIIVRACEHPQNTYADLDFILPTTITTAQDIPKTYLYVEKIETGNEIIDHLETVLKQRNPALANAGFIRPFNATMSPEYRRAAMSAFRSSGAAPDSETTNVDDTRWSGPIRILVCTDAAGMGCNVADVDLVVQWKLPAKLSNFVQRAGRAARGRNRTGLAVLLVERSAYNNVIQQLSTVTAGSTTAPPTQQSGNKRTKGRGRAKAGHPKGNKEHAIRHGLERGTSLGDTDGPLEERDQPHLDLEAQDEGLLAFVQSTHCRRRVWREIYDCTLIAQPELSVPCCDICDPSLFDRARPPRLPRTRKSRSQKEGLPDTNVQDTLENWREEVLTRDHSNAFFAASGLLDDDMITRLASAGPIPRARFKAMLDGWFWGDLYENELCDVLCSLEIRFIAKPKAASARQPAAQLQAGVSAESGPQESTSITQPPAETTRKRTRASDQTGTSPRSEHAMDSAPAAKRPHTNTLVTHSVNLTTAPPLAIPAGRAPPLWPAPPSTPTQPGSIQLPTPMTYAYHSPTPYDGPRVPDMMLAVPHAIPHQFAPTFPSAVSPPSHYTNNITHGAGPSIRHAPPQSAHFNSPAPGTRPGLPLPIPPPYWPHSSNAGPSAPSGPAAAPSRSFTFQSQLTTENFMEVREQAARQRARGARGARAAARARRGGNPG